MVIWYLHSENHSQTHVYFYASRSTMLLESGDTEICLLGHFLHFSIILDISLILKIISRNYHVILNYGLLQAYSQLQVDPWTSIYLPLEIGIICFC
jgi:hypothetical protein